jgi:thiol-disulfide isomerase/thioredoxin
MTSQNSLKWEDLVSPTLSPDEYLENYGSKVQNVYDKYQPKSEVLDKIRELLKKKKEKLKIVALGADWCPDCSKNIPSMIRIAKEINGKDFELKILYGIMKNALPKPGEPIWHKNRSPPEATNPKFDLKAIPTFYFFNHSGEKLGAIVENPEYESTLEEDILKILTRKL